MPSTARFTGGPANIDDLLTSTLEEYREQLIDNWFNGNPIMKHIYGDMKGSGTDILDGGTDIVESLDYQDNDTVAWVDEADTVSTTRNQILTHARYSWAVLAGSVVIGDHERAKNQGKNKMHDLMGARVKNLENSFKQAFDVAAGASSTPNTKTMWSLPDHIDSSNPTLGNLGDISRSTYSWWQATEVSSGSMATQGLEDIRQGYWAVSKSGTDFVTSHLTTLTLYRAYQARLTPFEILTSRKKGDVEFESLAFANKPASGLWLGINTKYLRFRINKNMNFKNQSFVRVPGGQTEAALVQTMCQLTNSRCASSFKLTSMTA
jgi:hypothetical protein